MVRDPLSALFGNFRLASAIGLKSARVERVAYPAKMVAKDPVQSSSSMHRVSLGSSLQRLEAAMVGASSTRFCYFRLAGGEALPCQMQPVRVF